MSADVLKLERNGYLTVYVEPLKSWKHLSYSASCNCIQIMREIGPDVC